MSVALWVKVLATFVGALCLPLVLPLLLLNVFTFSTSNESLGFVAVALGNSLLVAWLLRRGVMYVRTRRAARANGHA
jgi:hypothetical protein